MLDRLYRQMADDMLNFADRFFVFFSHEITCLIRLILARATPSTGHILSTLNTPSTACLDT